jgi:hypothetical protein
MTTAPHPVEAEPRLVAESESGRLSEPVRADLCAQLRRLARIAPPDSVWSVDP